MTEVIELNKQIDELFAKNPQLLTCYESTQEYIRLAERRNKLLFDYIEEMKKPY